MFRKREPVSPPPREPHPVAGTEIRLQRILSLRLAIARKEALLASDQEQLTALRRTVTQHPNWDGHDLRQGQIGILLAEIASLEAEVPKLHDDIAASAGGLDDVDLSYLDDRRNR